jgi:hypothetical protein
MVPPVLDELDPLPLLVPPEPLDAPPLLVPPAPLDALLLVPSLGPEASPILASAGAELLKSAHPTTRIAAAAPKPNRTWSL